eukprot:scaffold7946_cov403-Prasinococcus_capsulatus_cf.AAC.3
MPSAHAAPRGCGGSQRMRWCRSTWFSARRTEALPAPRGRGVRDAYKRPPGHRESPQSLSPAVCTTRGTTVNEPLFVISETVMPQTRARIAEAASMRHASRHRA